MGTLETCIACPTCGSENSHILGVDHFISGDYPKNKYGITTRQGGIAVTIACENCGQRWANITVEHKGETWIERRIEKIEWLKPENIEMENNK